MAKSKRKDPIWKAAITALHGRLKEPLWWFPAPMLLPVGLVLLLTAHLVSATNPRMGHPANLITFPGELRRDTAIWFSVTPIGNEIVVTTNDRRVFRWPQQLSSLKALAPFAAYLKSRVATEIAAAALLKVAFTTQTTAVIAADQRLKFFHVRPLLSVLAQAGIASYAFETQNPVLSRADSSSVHTLEHAP